MNELWDPLPSYLGGHVRMTLIALLIGVAVSLPLGILAARRPRMQQAVLAVASVIQTIPGLALLAAMVPLLALLSLPSIGMLPALIGLSLYSVLPILRNTVTGIGGVDPALVEAARGVGMSDRERLRMVELPLALPVIVAGVRTASVWVVGTATLSTPVGAPSLGNYIFSGLQTRNDAAVLLGCVMAAALALVLDGLIRVVERGLAEGKPRLRNVALALLGAGFLAAVVGPCIADARDGEREVIRVGSKSFTEQYILGAVLRDQVGEAGLPTELVPSLGSQVAFDALVSGDIDVYVDYSGTLWANVARRPAIEDRARLLDELTLYLAETHDVVLVGPLGFENSYALAVTRARAEQLGLRTIADLVPHAGRWTIGGDYEFFSRPEWQSLRGRYGLAFAHTRSMDSSLMAEAAQRGDVEVLSAFSTDGRIVAYDLIVLEDPLLAILPYDAVILVNGETAREHPELVEALRGLIGGIDAGRMREANAAVDLDGESIDEAAARLREGSG